MKKSVFKKYKRKQDVLRRSIIKVKIQLNNFHLYAENNFNKVYESLSEEEREAQREILNSFQWDNWNDLEYRLKERYSDNYGDFQSKSFEIDGIAIY